MSEHHAMPGASIPSPQLMVARLTGETERIRLGAGGIMLPNHVPLVVAEQIAELLSFLGNDFPQDHPYRHVHAVPGPWQAEQNRVPQPRTSADIWILGSSI